MTTDSNTRPPPRRIPLLRIVLVAAFILVFTASGVINLSNAVRFRTPPATTLAQTPAFSLPTYVTLQDITWDIEHLLKLKFGSEVLFVPVRAKGAPPQSEYPVLIQTSAADLIAAVGSNSPDARKRVAALAARTEVTGRVSTLDARLLESVRQHVPLVSRHAVLIDDGATPSPIFGAIMLSLGLGVLAIALAGGFKDATPAAVTPASPPVAASPVESTSLEAEIAWGGYYVVRDSPEGDYRVWRLLDLNQAAYHAALFAQKFPAAPTLAQVASLTPFVAHVPMDTRGLLSTPIQLIGRAPLTAADLEGYMVYLEHRGASPGQRAELASRLIAFSQQEPLRLRFAVIGDQLQITPTPA